MARVLIVEDESLIAEEINDRLTRLNYEVVGIEDTAERAWTTANTTRPDLVLMDIRLKGEMDGIQAADRIRRELNIPTVYLTAHNDAATLARAKETQPLGYLLKPFQERDLFVTLEIALHRHQMDGRLRASELKYATTLASIGDGVLATDADGKVTFLNPVAERLTQWSNDEAMGRPVTDVFSVIPEDRLGRIECPPLAAIRRRTLVRFDTPFLLVAKDGSTVLIDDCAAPILDGRGTVSGAVVAFRDIRERRAIEFTLRRTEEQLQRSQRLEALGRLAGGVAHDFNNHLTVISGYSQLLMADDRASAETRETAAEITKAAQRSAALTHQLLAFSRGQLMAPRVVDLNSLVRGTEGFLKRLIGENIELSTTLSADPAWVRADPGQLEQVVVNLAINARDAMPHGGRLVIGTHAHDTSTGIGHPPDLADGRYRVLTVTDTGVGMDEATRSRIFEPFFTTKADRHGTGLGLATTYGIARQSGGAIAVDSEPGRGSSFRVYLCATATADGETPRDQVRPRGAVHGTEAILLVEDEPAVRSLLRLALESRGFAVVAVGTAEAALHVAETSGVRIDALVTDIVLPGLNGRELAEHLWGVTPSLRVLFLSGYTDDEEIRGHASHPFAAFLQKPFGADDLTAAVREVLDRL